LFTKRYTKHATIFRLTALSLAFSLFPHSELAASHSSTEINIKTKEKFLLELLHARVAKENAETHAQEIVSKDFLRSDILETLNEKPELSTLLNGLEYGDIEDRFIRIVQRIALGKAFHSLFGWLSLRGNYISSSLEKLEHESFTDFPKAVQEENYFSSSFEKLEQKRPTGFYQSVVKRYPGLRQEVSLLKKQLFFEDPDQAADHAEYLLQISAQSTVMVGLYVGALRERASHLAGQLPNSKEKKKLREDILVLEAAVDHLLSSHPFFVILTKPLDGSTIPFYEELWNKYHHQAPDQQAIDQAASALLKERDLVLLKIDQFIEENLKNDSKSIVPLVSLRYQALDEIHKLEEEQVQSKKIKKSRFEEYQDADERISEIYGFNSEEIDALNTKKEDLFAFFGWTVGASSFIGKLGYQLAQKVRPSFLPRDQPHAGVNPTYRIIQSIGWLMIVYAIGSIMMKDKKRIEFQPYLERYLPQALAAGATPISMVEQVESMDLSKIYLTGVWAALWGFAVFQRGLRGFKTIQILLQKSNNAPSLAKVMTGKFSAILKVYEESFIIRKNYALTEALFSAAAGLLTVSAIGMYRRNYNSLSDYFRMLLFDPDFQENLITTLFFTFLFGYLSKRPDLKPGSPNFNFWGFSVAISGVRLTGNIIAQCFKRLVHGGEEDSRCWDINWNRALLELGFAAVPATFVIQRTLFFRETYVKAFYASRVLKTSLIPGRNPMGWGGVTIIYNFARNIFLLSGPYALIAEYLYHSPQKTPEMDDELLRIVDEQFVTSLKSWFNLDPTLPPDSPEVLHLISQATNELHQISVGYSQELEKIY